MKITAENFQLAVKYGGVAVAVSAVACVYMVLRNVELYRKASVAEIELQKSILGQQMMQGALQDLQAQSASDPRVAEIFRKVQAAIQAANQQAAGKEAHK